MIKIVYDKLSLNALVHRDYSVHTENVPIRIEMYRDRMEIINSGGLYGKISIDALGKVRPETKVVMKNGLFSETMPVADGKLKMTIPDKPKSSNQKFVKA